MGNSSSHVEDEFDKFDGIETLGYRVLGVQPDSPASQAGLVSFFDFLVGANNKMLLGSGEGLEEGDEYDDVDLPGLLQENLGKEIELLVYNIKSQETRFVTLVPSDSWGGAGLLGVTIRLDNYGGADERLIRVLAIEKNSPAAIAGLVENQDYLLGTVSESLEDSAQLANLLVAHVDQVLEFYVYNTDSDVVRVVALMPTLSWGGRGLLGAEVGTGYLHRLPHTSRSTPGSSIERKVRYVAPSSSSNNKNNNSNNDNYNNQQAVGETLEVEPALELETESGIAEHATPQQVADMSSPSSLSQEAQEGTSKIAAETTTAGPETSAEPETEGQQPTEAQLFFSRPPPTMANASNGEGDGDGETDLR